MGTTTATRSPAPQLVPTATLAEVDIREELDARPNRLPDYTRESEALQTLVAEMAENPRNMLQKLVEIAVDLCDADTSGISLLDGDVFRWEAVAGVFAGAKGGTMPRNESPCGVCIDRNATQLMHLADRLFPALTAEPRFVEALLIPFHDHGKAIGTVWIVSHRFDRKFDHENERVVKMLAQVASAGWQLWKASEAANASNERKDNFIAVLGHELRNPFASIMTAAGLLQLSVGDDATANRAVDVILRQSQHVSRLVDDLLDVNRINTGKLQLDRRVVDLRTVVTESIEGLRPLIERRKQTLTVDVSPDPVWVEGDPTRLRQVVSNLVHNAAKYTPESGQITVMVSPEKHKAILQVRDTGVGVPAEQAESIFEPFVQLHALESGGLGLGLALVRRLTQLHSGTVVVDSSGAGLGSCFTVRLPLHAKPSDGVTVNA